jgi:hypothetical protein
MAAQQAILRISKSIAGAALFVLGLFILYQNLAATVSRMSHILTGGSATLGVLPAAVLAVAQAVHAVDHHYFLPCLFRQILLSAWPLLLVICGTVLSRDHFADGANVQEPTTNQVRLSSVRHISRDQGPPLD